MIAPVANSTVEMNVGRSVFRLEGAIDVPNAILVVYIANEDGRKAAAVMVM